jgi:hypothetical protein
MTTVGRHRNLGSPIKHAPSARISWSSRRLPSDQAKRLSADSGAAVDASSQRRLSAALRNEDHLVCSPPTAMGSWPPPTGDHRTSCRIHHADAGTAVYGASSVFTTPLRSSRSTTPFSLKSPGHTSARVVEAASTAPTKAWISAPSAKPSSFMSPSWPEHT